MKNREVIVLSDDDDSEIQFMGHRQLVSEVPGPSSSKRGALSRIHEHLATHYNDNQVSIIILLIACIQFTEKKQKQKRVATSTLKDTRPRKQQRMTPTSTAAQSRRNTSANVSAQTRSNASTASATSTIRPPEAKRKQMEVIDLCSNSDEDAKPTVKVCCLTIFILVHDV